MAVLQEQVECLDGFFACAHARTQRNGAIVVVQFDAGGEVFATVDFKQRFGHGSLQRLEGALRCVHRHQSGAGTHHGARSHNGGSHHAVAARHQQHCAGVVFVDEQVAGLNHAAYVVVLNQIEIAARLAYGFGA